jgi:hypothetical protein
VTPFSFNKSLIDRKTPGMPDAEKQRAAYSGVDHSRDPRRYPRKLFITSVFFRCRHQKYRGLVINISRNGVFIETKNKFSFGQSIELVIPSTAGYKNIRLKGWIVRLSQSGIAVTFKRILERRSGKERRSDLDRRIGLDRRASRTDRAEA